MEENHNTLKKSDDFWLCLKIAICSQLGVNLSIVEYNMSLFTSDSLPRGSYVDDRNNPPIISATYLLFTAPRGCWLKPDRSVDRVKELFIVTCKIVPV
jgi:hypothetical protein